MIRLQRIIVQSFPFTFIAGKSKHIVLPGFYGVPLYDAFNFFIAELKKSGLNARAKSISFDFAMAIPPVLICIFTVIPYMPISKQFTKELLRLTRHITPSQNSYNFVNSFLTDFLNTPRVGLLSFRQKVNCYTSGRHHSNFWQILIAVIMKSLAGIDPNVFTHHSVEVME